MKISFVLDAVNMAGGIRVIAIYADRLKKRGHDVTVISRPWRVPTLLEQLRSLSRFKRLLPVHPKHPPSHLDAFDIDHRVIDRWRPIVNSDVPDGDVVIATWWETAPWVADLSPSKGAKTYLLQHHEVVFDWQPADRVSATWRLPLHKIVISRWLKELAADEYGDSDVSLVPNSVDTNQFHAAPRGRQSRPTVGMLYNSITRFKGCAVALEAIRRAQGQIPDLRVVSFGSQPISPQFPLPADALYVQSPQQHAIKDLYAQCDVWLCASHSEGFGLTVLEAMACRCPAVSTRVGGPIDFIEEGVNGHLVDVADAQGLADGLVRVLKLPEQRWRQMSDAALDTATRYSWDDAVVLFEKALEVSIEKSGAARHKRSLLAPSFV